MPNPPPLAPSGAPPPLRKFTLHPPSLTAANSPISIAANGNGAFSPAALQGLRQTLSQARQSAAERLTIRDANRRNLTDRQANEKRVAEEQARQKEAERKRKREEDERRERERIERTERERVEREREEGAQRKREEDEYQMLKKKEEDDKRRKDEEERQAAVKRAREMKEKKRAEEVFELVKANEEKAASEKLAAEQGRASETAALQDVKMEDAPNAGAALPPPPIPLAATTHVGPTASVPSIAVASSPEPDDDFGQPKPPVRHHDKKKRKRDHVIDSDASDSDGSQPLMQKARKLESKASTAGPTPSPTPQPNGTPRTRNLSLTLNGAPPPPPEDRYAGLSVIERKLKDEKFVKHSIPIRPPPPGTATAFYLPSHSLVPPKPVSIPPIPTPKRQADVRGDFSAAKPGTQIAHHTFHTWAEAYLRPFGEDDLAFLAPKPEDITPYLIPPLGKHYTERWEEEDSNLPIASTSSYASPLEPPPLLRTRPEHLTEDSLGAENVSLGPLSERLVAAMAFVEEGEESDEEEGGTKVKMEDGQGTAGGQADGSGAERRNQLDAVDLEERIKRELRFIGILPDEDVDWSAREDDEISSALRACQRELHHQTALNESRKVILTSIVKDRMAYQDYETTRDAQERIIENGWTKRQRSGKKKGKGKDRDKVVDGPKAPISLTLLEALDKRNKLVGMFKPFFEDEEDKGRFAGIPETSVYEGLEEMLAAEEEEEENEAALAML